MSDANREIYGEFAIYVSSTDPNMRLAARREWALPAEANPADWVSPVPVSSNDLSPAQLSEIAANGYCVYPLVRP